MHAWDTETIDVNPKEESPVILKSKLYSMKYINRWVEVKSYQLKLFVDLKSILEMDQVR